MRTTKYLLTTLFTTRKRENEKQFLHMKKFATEYKIKAGCNGFATSTHKTHLYTSIPSKYFRENVNKN